MALALLGVVIMHGLMIAWLGLSSAWQAQRRPTLSAPKRLTLRLIPPAPTPTVAVPVQAAGLAARINARAITATASARAPSSTTAPPLTTAERDAPTSVAETNTPPARAASAPPAGLSLLETEATRRAIRDSARSPGHDGSIASRLSPEARMATALGSDKLTEEDLGDGRRRFRQNGGCVESRPARASQLFPFAPLGTPNQMTDC